MYVFESRVRYSETDSREILTLPALTDYFQDCGTFQSEELGLGVLYLQKSHLAWVLASWQIVIEEYPHLCDTIRIGTFPYGFRGFIGYRNYTMDGVDGRRLAYANAIWTLIHTDTQKPAMPTPEMIEKYKLEEKLDMDYAPRRIAEPSEPDWQEAFPVKKEHLDSNYHVNNAQYIKMAMQYLPENADICQLRAEYKRQAHLQDMIFPAVRKGNDTYVISLCNEKKEPYSVIEFKQRREK